MGTAANAGFVYVRASRSELAARLVRDAVVRGLIEFYLRWNNIGDQVLSMHNAQYGHARVYPHPNAYAHIDSACPCL